MGLMIIMRGLPGSGKSTLANIFVRTLGRGKICSTDDKFICSDGVYRFESKFLPEAHEVNLKDAIKALSLGISPVIVDNTNIRKWEFERYESIAKTAGYKVTYMTPATPWAWDVDECFKRCTHGVPKEAIARMAERFEPL